MYKISFYLFIYFSLAVVILENFVCVGSSLFSSNFAGLEMVFFFLRMLEIELFHGYSK